MKHNDWQLRLTCDWSSPCIGKTSPLQLHPLIATAQTLAPNVQDSIISGKQDVVEMHHYVHSAICCVDSKEKKWRRGSKANCVGVFFLSRCQNLWAIHWTKLLGRCLAWSLSALVECLCEWETNCKVLWIGAQFRCRPFTPPPKKI